MTEFDHDFDLNEMTLIPLTDQQVGAFAKMFVGMYHNTQTGESFVSKSWAEKASPGMRAAIAAIVWTNLPTCEEVGSNE